MPLSPETSTRLVASPAGKLRSAVLVRPGAAIENARPLNGEPGTVYGRALEQHDVLRRTLEYFGVRVTMLDSRGEDAYETAVTDAAIVLADGAVVMRPTAMSRRAEADRIQAELAQADVPVAGRIEPPGLLDGTDVLLAGQTAFVAASARGNAMGRAGFAAFAARSGYRVVEVQLAARVRSLQAAACAVAKDTIVVARDAVDLAAFEGFRTIVLERGEEMGAGVICLGERHVIADVRYRYALKTMRNAGITVEGIDLYDFEKIGMTPSMLVLATRRD
jgi:dimethylargininase